MSTPCECDRSSAWKCSRSTADDTCRCACHGATRSVEELSYALAKQVPDIRCHAVFETNYGQLRLDALDSHKVAVLVERLLRAKLKKAGGK